MRIGLKTALAAAAMTAIVASQNAQALPLENSNVGGNYGANGTTISVDTGSLSSATVITFGSAAISSLPANYAPLNGSSAPNTFVTGPNYLTASSTVGSIVSLNVAGLTTGLTSVNIDDFLTFTGSSNGIYDFDVTGLTLVQQSSGYLAIEAFGTLVDTSDNYADTAAAALISFNQAGNSGTISGGFTLTSPPNFVAPPSVPEPMSLSLLGGGLATLGVMRRRKKAC
jgi:hypothetical protein